MYLALVVPSKVKCAMYLPALSYSLSPVVIKGVLGDRTDCGEPKNNESGPSPVLSLLCSLTQNKNKSTFLFYSTRRDRLQCSTYLRTQIFLSPSERPNSQRIRGSRRITKKGNLKPQRKLFFGGGEKFASVHAKQKRKILLLSLLSITSFVSGISFFIDVYATYQTPDSYLV